jgi:murein DD-endopeptidase MepM/ murein hydrolase activator NlpD
MKQNKNKNLRFITKLLVCLLIISFSLADFFILPKVFAQDELNTLNERIKNKKKEIDSLQQQIDAYSAQVKTKEKEAKSLKNQIAILDNQVAKINLDIEATEKRIEQTNLEIQSLNLQIEDSEKNINKTKEKIADYIRLIYKNDQVSYLEVMLTNSSFSDFFDQLKYTEEINSSLKTNLNKLKNYQKDLQTQKTSWQDKANTEQDLKDELQKKKAELTEKNNAQEVLLIQAKLTAKQYQSYVYQLQLEQQQANADIMTLEKTVRQKLEEREKQNKFINLGPAKLSWPVPPDRGLTATFHDPEYPFRYIFEHPAIDIRVGQGTPIKAPESGYVARVKFNGNTSYAYVMVIHNDGLSTVYGHVSKVYVKEDEYVSQGQVIAASGGMPGSVGAGNLTTGPHLHFEIRLNGIPVNPLDYLP